MPTYANRTTVHSRDSRDEIERTLARYGAGAFMYGTASDRGMIAFEIHGKRYRITLPLPDRRSREFTHTQARGYERDPKAQEEAYEQAVRQRWRALALVVKANLEAAEAGIMSFEESMLAHMVLPDNTTVAERLLPELNEIAATGRLPALLPGREDS